MNPYKWKSGSRDFDIFDSLGSGRVSAPQTPLVAVSPLLCEPLKRVGVGSLRVIDSHGSHEFDRLAVSLKLLGATIGACDGGHDEVSGERNGNPGNDINEHENASDTVFSGIVDVHLLLDMPKFEMRYLMGNDGYKEISPFFSVSQNSLIQKPGSDDEDVIHRHTGVYLFVLPDAVFDGGIGIAVGGQDRAQQGGHLTFKEMIGVVVDSLSRSATDEDENQEQGDNRSFHGGTPLKGTFR